MLKIAFINWSNVVRNHFFIKFIENYLKIQNVIDYNNTDIKNLLKILLKITHRLKLKYFLPEKTPHHDSVEVLAPTTIT